MDDDFYPLIDGISGPTISGGEKRILQLKIPKKLFDESNYLRFETAVEDKGYHTNDISVSLNENNMNRLHQGNGFIKNIKIVLQEK
jgi:pantothenate kinase-related protein Tda10